MAALLLVILLVPRLGAYVDAFAWMSAGTTFVAWSVTAVPTEFGKTTVDSVADGLIDHVHVLAVSAWVGGIAMLALLAITSHRHLTPAGAEVWARLWPRFSIVALVAVGCVLVSGAWLSWKHLGSPSELFDTSFGRVLLLKVSLVAVMIAVAAINEFLLMPRIARARAAGAAGSVFRLAVRVFPRLVALEALLALGVLFVLSFMTGCGPAPRPATTPIRWPLAPSSHSEWCWQPSSGSRSPRRRRSRPGSHAPETRRGTLIGSRKSQARALDRAHSRQGGSLSRL